MPHPAPPASAPIVQNDRKTINTWAMYDWANSAYALVIVSAIFPAYYNEITETDAGSNIRVLGFDIVNTAALSITLGIAFGIVALASPLLSSIADYKSNHRLFMRFFCYMGAAGCMILFFFDHPTLAPLALAGILFATVGYGGSIVFYNSYLPAIATPDQHDKVSARGFAFGYIGATTLLIISFILIENNEALGVADGTFFSRLSFLLTGLWWIGFAQIPLRKLPKGLYGDKGKKEHSFMSGYRELLNIWHQLKSLRRLRMFLFSFFFYIMGVQTVMFMAAAFGEKELDLSIKQLMVTILLVEYIGIAGAHLFAWISKRIGNIPSLMIAVATWIGICIGAHFMQTALHFYIAGFFIGIVMGGIQSLSRSTYAKLMPKTQHNAGFFSFFDVSEKIAMMVGLILFGTLDNITGSMRNSIIALGISFAIGFCILLVVRRMKTPAEILPTVEANLGS